MMTIKRGMEKYALGLAGLAMGAIFLTGWQITTSKRAHAVTPAAAEPAVPVTTAPVQVKDFPVFLNGLGTVQALNTVEIKAQVNGTLVALPQPEGQEVHKGDIIAEIDPRPYKAALDQAMAQRDADTATLRSAQLDLARYKNLAKSNFAPVQQVDDQQATVGKQTAAISVDNALIETAQINLGYCVIRAPFDGRVGLHQTDVGNLIEVASQTGIISLTQDKPISVVFTLPENDLARVQAAQARGAVPVQTSIAQSDKGNGQPTATGTLLTPNNTIDPTTGTISLKANFDNQDDHLWPGQFVNVRVRVETLHNAVILPVTAVQHGPDGTFVYVVKPDQTIAQVGIETEYQDDTEAVVNKGLTGKEAVVTSGQSRLSPGVRVAVNSPANGPPGTAQAANSTD
jgi:membrane fusion protein, multidrug efflux system